MGGLPHPALKAEIDVVEPRSPGVSRELKPRWDLGGMPAGLFGVEVFRAVTLGNRTHRCGSQSERVSEALARLLRQLV